ncbi:hypothetical protein CLI75_11850, partial [Porphyromonas gingivalis]
MNGILSEADPYKETSFLSVEMELLSRFEAAKTFRNTILFGSVEVFPFEQLDVVDFQIVFVHVEEVGHIDQLTIRNGVDKVIST